MEVKLKSLSLKGFRSFRDESHVEFEDSGLVLIDGKRDGGGSSGSGKSSVTLAVQYAFNICEYSASDLTCTYPDSKIQVKVTGEIDGEPFVLCRGAITSFSYKDISATGAKVVSEKLPFVFGDLDLMKYACFQNQQENSRFLALTDSQRKDFLGRILGLHKVAAALDEQKKKVKDNEEESIRTQRAISDKRKNIESIKNSLSLFVAKPVPSIGPEAESRITSEIEKFKQEQISIRSILQSKKQEVQSRLSGYSGFLSEQASLRAEDKRLREQLQALKIQSTALKQQKCPECSNDISDATEKLAKIKEKAVTLAEKIKSLPISSVEHIETSKKEDQAALSNLEAEIQSTYVVSPKENELRELNSLKKEIESSSQWNSQLEKKKETALKLIGDSEQEELTLIEKTKLLESEKSLILDFIDCFGKSGFVNQYIFQILEEIETEANSIIEDIPNLAGISFSFIGKTSDSGKNTVIPTVTKNGIDRPYKSFLSKGMSRSLELAVDLAVANVIQRRSGAVFKTVFYDEPFDGLDFKSKESAMEFFAMLGEEKSIYLIDHTSEIKEKFSSVLTVTFDGDKSKISTGG